MTQEHMNRFMQLVKIRLGEGGTLENLCDEYAAAFYLISCKESIFKLASKHVSRSGIDFGTIIGLEAYGYEQSHRALMRLAANLYFSDKVKGLDITDIQGPIIVFALRAIQIRMLDAKRIFTVDT